MKDLEQYEAELAEYHRKGMEEIAEIGRVLERGAAAVWRPIETAPRDCCILITFDPKHIPEDSFNPGIMVAYWEEYNGIGWCDWTSGEGCGEYFRNPTHWMPLPPPPQERSDAKP